MLEKIISEGTYVFMGSPERFKKAISNYKETKVIYDGTCCGIRMYEAIGKFRYHSQDYRIHVYKRWDKDELEISLESKPRENM